MLNNSAPGQAVYEPFSGSGPRIIAAESLRPHLLSMELDPAYVDVAVLRWQAFTGQEATLEGTAAASPRSPPSASDEREAAVS